MRVLKRMIPICLLAVLLSAETIYAHRGKGLDGCPALADCLAVLDKRSKDSASVFDQNERAIAAYLSRFGEPAKLELLRRATGSDPGWARFAQEILSSWLDFLPTDIAVLDAALQSDSGGWAAIPLARIGTPKALQLLADNLDRTPMTSEISSAFRVAGAKAAPYLLRNLEDDKRVGSTSYVLNDMRTVFAGMAPSWVAVAADRAAAPRTRLAALRALYVLGGDAHDQGPVLRPLLEDTDRDIARATAQALEMMGDIAALPAMAQDCVLAKPAPDDFLSNDEETGCLDAVAAYGSAALPVAPAIATRFLDSKNGGERARGAMTLGFIGYRPAIPKLIALLNDDDWRVAFGAARALGWLEVADAVPGLTHLARHHWLPQVREAARDALAALRPNGAPLPKPISARWREYQRPFAAMSVNALLVPDAAPCRSGHWRYGNLRFAEPRHSIESVRLPRRGRHPAVDIVGVDDGEFGGGLYWRLGDVREPIYPGNTMGVVLRGSVALAAFGEWGPLRLYEKHPKPNTEWISNGPSGYGFVLSVTPNTEGRWRLREVARLPRSPDAISAIAPDLYAAWSGGRVVVFTARGIQGLAACVR